MIELSYLGTPLPTPSRSPASFIDTLRHKYLSTLQIGDTHYTLSLHIFLLYRTLTFLERRPHSTYGSDLVL